MNQTHTLIKGTLLLTFMGGLTRIAGFFYKIFLSRTVGASEIGRYQLAIPAFTFCMALCGGGVQTAISRYVAEYCAKQDTRSAKRTLCAGLLLSGTFSVLCSLALYQNAVFIAERFLLEESCANLLRILAYCLPFSIIHGCICGYFMGRKNVLPPALAQLVEQLARILFAVLTYTFCITKGRQPDARLMVFGHLAGEVISAIYCTVWLLLSQHASPKQIANAFSATQKRKEAQSTVFPRHFPSFIPAKLRSSGQRLQVSMRQILSVSFPLGLNRMLMCALQAIEAALLPQMLQAFGHTSAEALSLYGTLTGMSMPMILFPTAATSALGMLLLPTVSEAHALHREKRITDTVNATFLGGMLLGSFSLGTFLLFGSDIGSILFHNALAGIYIRQLALICPLFYINTTMSSILHGLDRSASLLAWNLIGFTLRISATLILVPKYGMNGYLIGVLLDQLLLSICSLYSLYRQHELTVPVPESVTRSLIPAIAGGGTAYLFTALVGGNLPEPARLTGSAVLYCFSYLLFARFAGISKQMLHNARQ